MIVLSGLLSTLLYIPDGELNTFSKCWMCVCVYMYLVSMYVYCYVVYVCMYVMMYVCMYACMHAGMHARTLM